MFNPNPRVIVMGGPVPEGLRAELAGNVELLAAESLGESSYAGVLVHARAESLPAVRKFRMAGGQLPIYGLAEAAVTVNDRILWIREGADDLIPLASCAGVLVRRLRGAPTRLQPAHEAVPVGVRLDRYLVAMGRYVGVRRVLADRVGGDGPAALLDMSFHRDQVMRAADVEVPLDAFGQRRAGDREALAWTIRVMDPSPADGDLVNIGPDGMCLGLVHPVKDGQAVRFEVEGLTVSAVVEGEVRWSRQVEKSRWEAGLYAHSVVLGGMG